MVSTTSACSILSISGGWLLGPFLQHERVGAGQLQLGGQQQANRAGSGDYDVHDDLQGTVFAVSETRFTLFAIVVIGCGRNEPRGLETAHNRERIAHACVRVAVVLDADGPVGASMRGCRVEFGTGTTSDCRSRGVQGRTFRPTCRPSARLGPRYRRRTAAGSIRRAAFYFATEIAALPAVVCLVAHGSAVWVVNGSTALRIKCNTDDPPSWRR
jgi:hypothetical protein